MVALSPAVPAVPAGWMRYRRWAAALGLAATALLSARPAAAVGFLESYKAGIEALEAGDPQEAAGLFREAAGERSGEQKRLLGRFYFKPYLPYYYLGQALFQTGDCPGALEAWAESERQGVVLEQDEERASLEQGRTACRQRAAALESAEATAREALRRAEEAAVRVEAGAASPELAPEWDEGESDSLRLRQREALALLDQARSRLQAQADATDPGGYERVEAEAAGARQRLEDVLREAERRREQIRVELQARRQGAWDAIERLAAAAGEALAAAPRLAGEAPALSRRRAEVEAALGQARSLPAEASLEDLEAVRSRLQNGVARLRSAAAPPPRELVTAAGAFLAGDYPGVIATLEGRSFSQDRAAAHAHLLRAAARYYLYLEDGSRDEGLREAALQGILDARRADPDLIPPQRAFSPRFLAFYREVAGGEAAPADGG